MNRRSLLFLLILSSSLAGCFVMRSSKGGGQAAAHLPREIRASDIALPEGYHIEAIATGLNFPTAVAFDDEGTPYVIEAGYSYGEVWELPKLLKIENGKPTTIATGSKNGPWTGIAYHKGYFYVAEGGEAQGGRILRISPRGKINILLEGLPSIGDHHTNGPVIFNDYLYFGQGTATNSGVVGEDNAQFGWLLRHPEFHDIPCRDIQLTGYNYESGNPLTGNPDDKVLTGAYQPFGTPSRKGQIIKGTLPCSGAIMRIPLTGGPPELVAWGLRNPFGLSVSPDGKLYVTENAFDSRGSRPVWGAGDVLWEVKQGAWYGWPDYSAGQKVAGDEEFKTPGKAKVKSLLLDQPGKIPKPVAVLGVHSSSNGLDFSTNDSFGYKGQAFIAQFGDMAPNVGKVLSPVGFKVVRVDIANGVVEDFAVNKGKRNGPASWLGNGGLERPISVSFDPSGENLYIIDFGILSMTDKGPVSRPNTGVIWKISK